MKKENYIDFIGKGIRKLQTALLTDLNYAGLHFPTCICLLWQIDESGNLLFRLQRPYLDRSGCAPEMYLQLQFFNGNYPYFITVEGKAVLLSQETATMLYAEKGEAGWSEKEIVLCFTIEKADYNVQREKQPQQFFTLEKKIVHWLFPEMIDRSRNF